MPLPPGVTLRDSVQSEQWAECERRFHYLARELSVVTTSLHLVDRVLEFPFDLLCHWEDFVFFEVFVDAAHRSAAVSLTALLDGAAELGIPRLRNLLVQHYLKAEYRSGAKKWLEGHRPTPAFRREYATLRTARNVRIAHLNKEHYFQDPAALAPLDLIRRITREAERQLAALHLGAGVHWLAPAYTPGSFFGPGHVPDIDLILDDFARRNTALAAPEREDPGAFRAWWDAQTPEDQNAYNRWRRRIGRSPC